jgi:cytochrome c peroxidase
MFSDSLFLLDFFSPNERYKVTPLRVELGRSLFYDSIFSTTAKRSCASCHNPSKAFTDGLKTPAAIQSSVTLKRNTPTLLNAVWQTKFFYDSRASTLENQLNAVVHNVDEMNGSLRESIERIRENEQYSKMFAQAYVNDAQAVTEYNIANAISSYVRSLSSLDSRFDKYMRGQGELTAAEKKGFNLFTGKAKCATCHYIPLFNGLVPPFFTETESEVLGIPSAPRKKMLDDDTGRFDFTKSVIHKHAFKTPTLRHIAQTAPYMHNGVFSTLEEVIDFYDKGGGLGMGIDVGNQTLPPTALHLSRSEKKNIVAFLKTLGARE